MSDVKIDTSKLSMGTDIVVDNRLRFENGRLYVTRVPYNNGQQTDFPELVDVTEDVLDMFDKILTKRAEDARQAAIIRQLSNR